MPRRPKETVADVPALLSEWDDEANTKEGLFPHELGSQSNKIAHWKCEFGHEWTTKVSNRYRGGGCPYCSKRGKTSYSEQAVFFYVKKRFPDAISHFRDIFPNGMELDIYVPSLKIGVEYDGAVWHPDSNLDRERKKFHICKQHGIKLLRIKENRNHWDSSGLADEIIRIIPDKPRYLDRAIRIVLTLMGDHNWFDSTKPGEETNLPSPWTNAQIQNALAEELQEQSEQKKPLLSFAADPKVSIDVDTKRDRYLILETFRTQLGKDSFAAKHPDEAKEWDYSKNGKLTPDMFAEKSSIKVWWICKDHKHSWQASFSVRARGNGCPYCSGRRVLVGFNDLKTKHPVLAAQWHPTKNGDKKPTDFTFGSGHKAWWLCPVCGQSWEASINNRTVNGRGCPFCQHEKPIQGKNDLATVRPDLMEEWDYQRNVGKNPSSFMPSSNKKVFWKCKKCGFVYRAMINNRSKGSGCPRCAGQVLIPGTNDLASLCPKLVDEWDIEKNGGLKPSEVFGQTNKKYWWKDSFGHSWQASPNRRMRGTNCPVCSGNKIQQGSNDVATTYPSIAAEWHPTKNGSLTPFQISRGYTKKVWFLCPRCGGEYETYIGNKIKGFGKCPHCSKRKTRAKKVYLVETGQYFDTLRQAAQSIGQEDIRSIQACCAGRIRQAFGLHWEYRTLVDKT